MNNPTPKISIIVPIYKVEKYLRQCVDSILAQTQRDLEVILVDDGSPDACPRICDEYAAKDARIRVIHQSNGGYGKAVNNGLTHARGEYIGIVESDDWIEPDMYQKLYQEALSGGADLVKCDFYSYNSFENPPDTTLRERIGTEFARMAPEKTDITIGQYPVLLTHHPSIWAALYKKELLNKIRFEETPGAAYQDFSFGAETLCQARNIRLLHDKLVHYRYEPGQNSSTRQNDRRLMQIATQIRITYHKLKQLPVWPQIKEAFYYHAADPALAYFAFTLPARRKEFVQAMHPAFEPLLHEKDMRFTYFRPEEKAITLAFARADAQAAQKLLYQTRKISLGGLPLYLRRKNPYERHIFLLGVPVYGKMSLFDSVQYFLFGKKIRIKTHRKKPR